MPDPRDEAKMPPIPDGGLSESMPDWLRRPPAWRTLKDADVVQTEPVASDRLPEPDTSIIDPRSILTEDDLPLWLRNMGRGMRSRHELPGDDEAVKGEARRDRTPHAPGGAAHAHDRAREQPAHSAPASRFVPRTPTVSAPAGAVVSTERLAHEAPRNDPAQAPWWQGARAVLMLSALLLAAVVVIAILALY